MNAIRITDIAKSFHGTEILKGITLELEEGKTHGLTGANGCGKSVLMQIIAGLIKPDKGTVCVFDRQIGKDADFSVIDRDPYEYENSDELYEMKPVLTMNKGNVTFVGL